MAKGYPVTILDSKIRSKVWEWRAAPVPPRTAEDVHRAEDLRGGRRLYEDFFADLYGEPA